MKLLVLLSSFAFALHSTPAPPLDARREASFEGMPGTPLPKDAKVTDETGRVLAFGSLLRGRPALLVPFYFGCPSLCSTTLENLVHTLRPMSESVGVDFDVLAVSFDPNDTPSEAAERRAELLDAYGRTGAEDGWRLLTSPGDGPRRLLDAAGWRASYDAPTRLYAHPAAILVLAPDGTLSAALAGPEFSFEEIRRALEDARNAGRVSKIARVAAVCSLWDPSAGRFGRIIVASVRVLGALTACALAAFVTWRRQTRRGAVISSR